MCPNSQCQTPANLWVCAWVCGKDRGGYEGVCVWGGGGKGNLMIFKFVHINSCDNAYKNVNVRKHNALKSSIRANKGEYIYYVCIYITKEIKKCIQPVSLVIHLPPRANE